MLYLSLLTKRNGIINDTDAWIDVLGVNHGEASKIFDPGDIIIMDKINTRIIVALVRFIFPLIIITITYINVHDRIGII